MKSGRRKELQSGRPAPSATSYMVGLKNKRTNNRTMLPTLKNNAAAGYQGSVKIELLKGAGLLLQLEGYSPVRCLRSTSQNLLAVPKCNLDSCGLSAA